MSNNVAITILRQLGGAVMLSMMIGAKNFIAGNDHLSFKFSNKGAGKPNHIKVTLHPSDTYSVQFGRIWGLDFKVLETVEGVYCDNLKSIIEDRTGLYLSF